MVRTSRLAVIVLLTACASVGGTEGPRNVADAEIAFARDAQVRTVNEAFVTAFAPGSIMFRPTPVDAHESLKARPIPPTVLLVWTPSHTETSAAGDLAISTGPSQRGIRGNPPPTGNGYFLSVWRWNGKKWQVVFDAGIDAPIAGPVEVGVGTLSARTLRPSPSRSDDIAQMQNDVLHLERQLIKDYPAALREHGASDMRVYRDGKAPTATISDALNAVSGEDDVEWTPQAAFVSKSGDLGYVYGSTRRGTTERGYIRIWRNQDGRWKIAYDLR